MADAPAPETERPKFRLPLPLLSTCKVCESRGTANVREALSDPGCVARVADEPPAPTVNVTGITANGAIDPR